MRSRKLIRRSLLVAVLGLMLTALSGGGNSGSTTVQAGVKRCCSPCAARVQNDRDFCNFLIEVCGVAWFADPCEFSPVALCQCATNCDPGC